MKDPARQFVNNRRFSGAGWPDDDGVTALHFAQRSHQRLDRRFALNNAPVRGLNFGQHTAE